MNHERHDEAAFLAAARAELERGCDTLDARTRARLRGIRQDAVARARTRRPRLLAPFGALATSFALALALVVLDRDARAPEPSLPVEDLEILGSADLEFYEDFEFYQWLAENDASIQ